MKQLSKEFLVGTWVHEDYKFELTMFNFLVIRWPDSSIATGGWILRENEVIFTFKGEQVGYKQHYHFSITEIIDKDTIRTIDLEKNKEEILQRES